MESPQYYVSFNQDCTCFAFGSPKGFRIYNVDPFREMFKRNFEGGIKIIQMLYRTNILALVVNGQEESSLNKVILWDDHSNHGIGLIDCHSPVLNIKLMREVIVIVLVDSILIYSLDCSLISKVDTYENPLGVCAIAKTANERIIACSGTLKGQIRVMKSMSSPKIQGSKAAASVFIQANKSGMAAVALNEEASRVAVASITGTIIRLFDAETAVLMFELRRGSDSAVIYSLSFDKESNFLACSSDKGTVHVFALVPNAVANSQAVVQTAATSPQAVYGSRLASTAAETFSSMFSTLKGTVPLPKYLASEERSFAQFRIPADKSRSLVSFSADGTSITVLTFEGQFFQASIEQGECTLQVSRQLGVA